MSGQLAPVVTEAGSKLDRSTRGENKTEPPNPNAQAIHTFRRGASASETTKSTRQEDIACHADPPTSSRVSVHPERHACHPKRTSTTLSPSRSFTIALACHAKPPTNGSTQTLRATCLPQLAFARCHARLLRTLRREYGPTPQTPAQKQEPFATHAGKSQTKERKMSSTHLT